MSAQKKVDSKNQIVSEKSVSDYLSLHPNFFENQQDLLKSLNLSHASGGAVSLIERQITILRQKEISLQNQLNQFISVARANDIISKKIYGFTIELFATTNLDETLRTIKNNLINNFDDNESALIIFDRKNNLNKDLSDNFFHILSETNESLIPFNRFLEKKEIFCGKVSLEQSSFLFKENAHKIKSIALIPIGVDSQIGFLAIGNNDLNHFHPGMSIDFLKHIGDLLASALKRYF
tara:strand:+ start:4224 stop:4931 length:708 start_codon:yes stop_codon:yes gene_type:complete